MNYLIPTLFAFISIEVAFGLKTSPTCSCGVKTLNKIVGGQEATQNEYPWMVAICSGTPCNLYYQVCGGSLINNKYVLTAAYCLRGKNESNIYVSIGDHDLSTTTEMDNAERRAGKIIIHPQYSYPSRENDIALIKLNEKVYFSSKIRPICLPSPVQSYAGEKATVTGWGTLDPSGQTDYPSNLHEVDVQVISNKECSKSNNYSLGEISERMICAAAEGKDACQGDYGGPLIYNDRGYWEQIGVVSWGYGCAEPGYPRAYTRVTSFKDWILNKIGTNGQWCSDIAQ